MKSIKQQYIDLTEGKMSQGNFMRNLRMTMPQYVTNVTSFGDAVRILKNKGIISEVLTTEEEEVFSQGAQDESITTTNTTAGFDSVSEEDEDKTSDEDAEFEAILKQLEDEMAGEIAVKSDRMEEPLEEINEGKEPKAVDENLEEVTLGISMEHECFPELDYDAVEKMVKKNIKKNPNYYTNYKLTGIRDYELQTMDSSKPEDHQMKFYTEKTAVDTARGMKKIKVEKKKIKEAMEVDQTGQLKPQLPSSADTERLLKFLKNNTTFVSMLKNINNVTELAQFWRELLQLTDPELQALSDTQLQSVFRKAVLDFRKETGVPNQIFSKNANIQKGINDIGGIKEAEMPTEDKIEMELSSALSQQPTLKRILQKVDLPTEVDGTIKALLDRTNLKNIPDQIILAALRKVLSDTPGPTFTAQYAANANVGKPNPALGKTLEEKLRSMVREILAEEAPSKKNAASEITAKAVDYIDDYNEGEGKEYKKKWLENVFDSYEDKVGRRFDDSVFEDVIDMLKSKGYTMTMKETFDGRDNLTNISDDTK